MENINELIILESASVKQSLITLDETAKKILLVTNKEEKLVGTITDGDIRRWILKNGDLEKAVKYIMNNSPKYVFEDNKKEAVKIMLENGIDSIPVVDKEFRIKNVIFLGEQYGIGSKQSEDFNNPVVIMAGGLGTRLYPYTKILPKPLIPIGDIPIVERIMNKFKSFGFNKFYLTVNYKKNMIKHYFNDFKDDYNISYVDEDRPLGTGGGLSLLRGVINETFFVSNCDILIDVDYEDILKHHKSSGNKVTVITSLKNFKIPYGVFMLDNDGSIDKIDEKPEYSFLINTGMYILEPEVLKDIPQNAFFNLPDIIEKYINKNVKVGIYPISEKAWMDMGQINEMKDMIGRIE